MSQYLTVQDLSSGTANYQTVATSSTSAQSTAITARRIMITTGTLPAFVLFGTNPTAVVNSSFQIPANTAMWFNFKTGDKVAAVTSSASAISILVQDISQ